MKDILLYSFPLLATLWLVAHCWLWYRYIRLRKQKENEYYTDYVHNNLILRIYKPEFEYQAIGNVPLGKLLDRGNFSQFYVWALIEK